MLPVTVLLRRAYAAERVWAALVGRAGGCGHRRIGAEIQVPTATAAAGVVCRCGGDRRVDVRIPDGSGCGRRDALAAVEAATAAITSRFGAAGLLGVVTPVRVAVAASSGRLLAPGWPWAPGRGEAG